MKINWTFVLTSREYYLFFRWKSSRLKSFMQLKFWWLTLPSSSLAAAVFSPFFSVWVSETIASICWWLIVAQFISFPLISLVVLKSVVRASRLAHFSSHSFTASPLLIRFIDHSFISFGKVIIALIRTTNEAMMNSKRNCSHWRREVKTKTKRRRLSFIKMFDANERRQQQSSLFSVWKR